MEEFRILTNINIEESLNFLSRNPIDNSFLIGNIQKDGLESTGSEKKKNSYYGYYFEKKLQGIFAFTNTGSLIPYYKKEDILNKIVLLKTIKKHKPKYLIGMTKMVEPLWSKLEKTTKLFKYDTCNYMVLNKEKFSHTFTDKSIVDAKSYEFSKAIDFLIEVEKAFGRNPNIINELKNKIYGRIDEEEYLYLLDSDRIVAQGMIQSTSSQMEEVGGIFTLDEYRGKGYGKALVSRLCQDIIDRGKNPYLIVSKINKRANDIYRHIGFEYYDDYLMIELQII